MTNADLFRRIFGLYAEEFWSMPTDKMTAWLMADAPTVESEQQWIPIGSNPITTGLYLVMCNEWGKSMYRICAYYSETGKWIENGKNITKSITHWMPLPEPWKGKNDEDNNQI